MARSGHFSNRPQNDRIRGRGGSAGLGKVPLMTPTPTLQNDSPAPVTGRHADAPVTCQFVLEDHAVRHSYHHLARLKRAVA